MNVLRPNLLVGSLLATIAACGGPPADRQSLIMDKIEQQVRLPEGALRYDEYSRYYAEAGKDRIAAAYVAHDRSFRDFAATGCATVKEKVFPCSGHGKSELAASGERMWLPRVGDLPIPQGGGCGAVTFLYRPSTNTFSQPECNGSY
jgi:hypothetical protein